MENTIINWLADVGLGSTNILQLLFSLMISILFIQSGLDKLVNWKGEKAFYADHFKDTILGPIVPLLMPIITISELGAGFFSAIGIITLLVSGDTTIGFLGMLLAALSIIQLFLGQRIAKDFAGAASLVAYFLLAAAGLYFYTLG